jgi:hypothetical protein
MGKITHHHFIRHLNHDSNACIDYTSAVFN